MLNHDVMRQELRDKEMPPTPCPECDWVLSAARQTVLSPSDRFMTRDSVVDELMARMDADISAGIDYCIGETEVKALFERYRKNEPF